MWKRFDQRQSRSRRIAGLSDRAYRVWAAMLPHTDAACRYPADPQFVRSTVFPWGPLTEDQVAAAIDELATAGSIRLYEHDGERYLEYHHGATFNPPGNWRRAAEYPAPTRRDETRTRRDPDPGTLATASVASAAEEAIEHARIARQTTAAPESQSDTEVDMLARTYRETQPTPPSLRYLRSEFYKLLRLRKTPYKDLELFATSPGSGHFLDDLRAFVKKASKKDQFSFLFEKDNGKQ